MFGEICGWDEMEAEQAFVVRGVLCLLWRRLFCGTVRAEKARKVVCVVLMLSGNERAKKQGIAKALPCTRQADGSETGVRELEEGFARQGCQRSLA
jgi:hypothetical protein